MAEAISVGESVTVEVTRAGALNFPAVAVPSIDIVFVFVSVLIALALIAYAVRRHMRKTGMVTGPSRKGDLIRSIVIAAIIGFAGFMLSLSPFSWILAIGVFYHQFFIKKH